MPINPRNTGQTLRFRDRYDNPYLVYITQKMTAATSGGMKGGMQIQEKNLTGSDEPLTIDLDDATDRFQPVRSTSGNLQLLADNGTMPITGIYDTFSYLVRLYTGNPAILLGKPQGAVSWQGWLSPESYRQPWTARPVHIDYPLVGMLDAMDSVHLDPARVGRKTIRQVLHELMAATQAASGHQTRLFGHLWYSACLATLLDTVYIDTAVFITQHEQTNEHRTTYTTDTQSARDILEKICTFLGCTVSEWADGLYLQFIGEEKGLNCITLSLTKNSLNWNTYSGYTYTDQSEEAVSPGQSILLNGCSFRGEDHSRSSFVGARSVEIVATIKRDAFSLSLPDRPDGDLLDQYAPARSHRTADYQRRLLLNRPCDDLTAYSHIAHQLLLRTVACRRVETRYPGDPYPYYEMHMTPGATVAKPGIGHYTDYTIAQLADLAMFAQNRPVYTGDTPTAAADIIYQVPTDDTATRQQVFPVGSFFTRYFEAWTEEDDAAPAQNTWRGRSALYCCFAPCTLSEMTGYTAGAVSLLSRETQQSIFAMRAAPVTHQGYIRLQADMRYIWNTLAFGSIESDSGAVNDNDDSQGKTHPGFLSFRLQVGDHYWNGSAWQTSYCFFATRPDNNNLLGNWADTMPIEQTDGLLIPVPEDVHGVVVFSIGSIIYTRDSVLEHEYAAQNGVKFCSEVIFRDLDLSFIEQGNLDGSDRTNNTYFRLTGADFADAVTVRTELASDLGNRPSPSLILIEQPNEEAIREDDEQPLILQPAATIPYHTPAQDGNPLGNIPARPPQDDYERPEHNLLKRLADWYAVPVLAARVETEYPQYALPNANKDYPPLLQAKILADVRGDQRTLQPVGYSWEVAANRLTLTMLEAAGPKSNIRDEDMAEDMT